MQLGQLRLDLIINILDGETKIKSFTKTVNGLDTAFDKTKKESVTLSGALQNVGLRVQGLTGIFSILKSTVGDMVSKFNEFKSAQLGLQSVATFKNLDPAVVSNTIRSLDSVAAGLIGVGDASTSLKNLLSANFTLEQSVELLKRLSDAALILQGVGDSEHVANFTALR